MDRSQISSIIGVFDLILIADSILLTQVSKEVFVEDKSSYFAIILDLLLLIKYNPIIDLAHLLVIVSFNPSLKSVNDSVPKPIFTINNNRVGVTKLIENF